MMSFRPSIAHAFIVAAALTGVMTAVAHAQPAPDVQPVQMPSPMPQPTVSGSPIPYPAYGTPAPDVAALKNKPGVPQSISLEQADKIAVALSPVFASDNAQWAAIHAKYTSSIQALYPGASGSATYGATYNNGTAEGSSSGSGSSGVSTSLNPTGETVRSEGASITINQLIFDGGRTIANIRSSKEADFSGRATLLRDLQTLALNVSNAYYAVLEDNATVVADAQLVREFEVNEASVAAQIRNGAAARSDIAAAQFQTAQAKGNLVTAQGVAIGAQATFATTLGLDADAEVLPQAISSQNQQQSPNPTYAASLQRAMLMRPDYIAADYNLSSAKDNLRYAKLARAPVITAAASDGVVKNFIPSYTTVINPNVSPPVTGQVGPIDTWENEKALGLTMSIPIYDQGVTNYNVALAASNVDTAVSSLNQTRLQVQSDVRSALASLISARALLVQAKSELTSAQVSLDATQAQYKVGATTILNVTTAEANLATAQASYIAALYGVQTAQQSYLYAVGISDVQL
jgi:outer membrane protein